MLLRFLGCELWICFWRCSTIAGHQCYAWPQGWQSPGRLWGLILCDNTHYVWVMLIGRLAFFMTAKHYKHNSVSVSVSVLLSVSVSVYKLVAIITRPKTFHYLVNLSAIPGLIPGAGGEGFRDTDNLTIPSVAPWDYGDHSWDIHSPQRCQWKDVHPCPPTRPFLLYPPCAHTLRESILSANIGVINNINKNRCKYMQKDRGNSGQEGTSAKTSF